MRNNDLIFGTVLYDKVLEIGLGPDATSVVPAGLMGRWLHFQGLRYRVLCRAINTDNTRDGQEMVVYQDVQTGKVFTRALGEFWQTVRANGVSVPRFERE